MLFGQSYLGAQAQQTVVTTGLDIISNSGSISYTIGQIDYINSGTSISVSQGIQQSFDKLEVVVTSTISISIWPNPALDMLSIKITDDIGEGLDYQIFSMNGRLLDSKKNKTNFLNISLANFSQGAYILMITHLSQKAIPFKIIKL